MLRVGRSKPASRDGQSRVSSGSGKGFGAIIMHRGPGADKRACASEREELLCSSEELEC